MSAVDLGYAAGWRLVRALPRPAAWALFRAGADAAARRSARADREDRAGGSGEAARAGKAGEAARAGKAGKAARAGKACEAARTGKGGNGVARLRVNLRQVVGPEVPAAEFEALVKRALRSYARYWMEAFRLPSTSHADRLRLFRLERGDLLGEDVAAGRGAVVALPHAGNWDAAGAWVAAKGWPITTVAERLKPESVYERFLEFRRSLGMEIVPATGGDRPPFDVLLDRVRAGSVVPLLADRDLSARGVEVEFFGGRTRMPAGPALLALRSGAPLYVASMWYEPDAACGYLEGPLPVPDPAQGSLDVRARKLTQMIADRLAAGIARHPEDWHMLQRLWLDDGRTPAASGRASSQR